MRTRKALGAERTAIEFKQPPFAMFRDTPVDRLSPDYLVILTGRAQGIELQVNTKVPALPSTSTVSP